MTTDTPAAPAEYASPPSPAADPGDPQKGRGIARFFQTRADSAAIRSLSSVNRIYWLLVLYIGVWLLLRTRGIGGPPLTHGSIIGLDIVFGLAVVNLALRTRAAVLRGGVGRSHPSRLGWLFTVFDFSIIAAGLRLSGGIDSGLWPVLLFVVAAETVLERTPEAWAVRTGAALALIVATIPWPPVGGPWLLEVTTRLVFLMAVSSIIRRLRELSDREKAEVATLRAELALSEQRGTLSRDIHDGVGNSLAAAVLRMEFAARMAEKQGSEEQTAMLRDEAQALRQAMTSVRDWTFFARPWSPDALIQEVERMSRRTGLAMSVTGAEILDQLSPHKTTGLTVVRIAQEALTNAAKHAEGAKEVTVHLSRDSDWLTLTITDDGVGLPSDQQNAGVGLGMSQMRERAEGAGGTLRVNSAPGKGVTIVARLPYE